MFAQRYAAEWGQLTVCAFISHVTLNQVRLGAVSDLNIIKQPACSYARKGFASQYSTLRVQLTLVYVL